MHYLVLATESNETETWVVQRTFTSDSELTKEQLEHMFLVAHWKEFAEEGSAPNEYKNWTTDDYEEFYTSNDGIIYVDHYYQSTTPLHLEEVAK